MTLARLRPYSVSLIADGLDACGRRDQVLPPSFLRVAGSGRFEGVARFGDAGSGDVVVIARAGRPSAVVTLRGVAGVIVDGVVADIDAARAVGLSVVAGTEPFTVEPGFVRLGGVSIVDGDLLFGDDDGVVCVPYDEALLEELSAWLATTQLREADSMAQLKEGQLLSVVYKANGQL